MNIEINFKQLELIFADIKFSKFKDRCDKCTKECDGKYPGEVYLSPTHMVTCYNIPTEQGRVL